MVQSPDPPANAFVKYARKIYNPIGFSKAYNFCLFFIFGGALFGFTLARFEYLDFEGRFCARPISRAAPGECYYWRQGRFKIGIIMHLATILPASILVIIQFIPVVRYKAIWLHRINGWIVMLLTLVSMAAVLMIARVTFGGGLASQLAVGFGALFVTVSFILAYWNIKRLQIDQHRKWMLRAWAILGVIITQRLIQMIAVQIITIDNDFWVTRPCPQLASTMNTSTLVQFYPDCQNWVSGTVPNQRVVVHAVMNGRGEEAAAALGTTFGMTMWAAATLHILAVELYLHLTPAESERLRRVSYKRQLEAGMKKPGNAGLTVQRLGDAEPWVPPQEFDESTARKVESASS